MKDKEFPITRDISCLHCGKRGLMDIHDERDDVSDGRLFLHLGHNPFSGNLHYQCPACRVVLLVDPMLALGERPIRGVPQPRTGKKAIMGEGGGKSVLHRSIRGLLARHFLNGSDDRRLS